MITPQKIQALKNLTMSKTILEIIAENASLLANSRIETMFGIPIVSWGGIPKGEVWFVGKYVTYKYDNKRKNKKTKRTIRE